MDSPRLVRVLSFFRALGAAICAKFVLQKRSTSVLVVSSTSFYQ